MTGRLLARAEQGVCLHSAAARDNWAQDAMHAGSRRVGRVSDYWQGERIRSPASNSDIDKK